MRCATASGFRQRWWYRIADEEGILIQDEFPYLGRRAKDLAARVDQAQQVGPENTPSGCRERWNHPCVVIWDAQNETRHGGKPGKRAGGGARPRPVEPTLG